MTSLTSLLLMLAAVLARADNEVVGTIHFSLDGDEQTWYVLESPVCAIG